MFNKKEYWKNRKAGIRGQGVTERTITDKIDGDAHFDVPHHTIQVGNSFRIVNRKAARQMGHYGDNK